MIPDQLGNLSRLESLSLGRNQLTGNIPVELANLTRLESLHLGTNQLTGPIPSEIGQLANLTLLYLFRNRLTGSIPGTLGGLSSLERLGLSNNRLTGTIPPELGSLAHLEELTLHYNQLTGSIPAALGQLPGLELLYLNENQLTGPIPSELGSLNRLSQLWLRNNRLTGAIPSPLGNLARLEWLYLDNNQLTGTIPSSFTNLAAVNRFYFYLNPGLCAQDAASIRTWLDGVADVRGPDCAPTVRLTVNPARLVEGDGGTDVTITARRTAVSSDTAVDLRVGGSAQEGTDYTLSALPTVVIPANSSAATAVLTITPLTDTLAENDENIILEAVVGNKTEGSATLELIDIARACVDRDRAALDALYHAAGGANWIDDTNWLSDRPLSAWFGVTVDSNGCVTDLDLDQNQLTGMIPSRLGDLRNLQALWMRQNALIGTIPVEFTNLTDLRTLALWGNQLTGTIPTTLGDISALERLWLGGNRLTGGIPAELGRLANLESLSLWGNQLTGTIPTELRSLASLESMSLDRNQLTGTIPAELGNLANLLLLGLSNNELTGTIPAELGNLTNLESLSLQGNQLTGTIPTELGALANLELLWLYGNQLTGSVPAELGRLANLQALRLDDNELTGEIPAELGNLANLESLGLFRNRLTGDIPTELGNLANLESLGLYRNRLTGEIPAELGNLAKLEYLDLDHNQLTGRIPTELGNLANLEFLYLDNNQLAGTVPTELGALANLELLWLHDNQLTGMIPPSFTNLGALDEFYFYLNPELCAQDGAAIRTWLNGVTDVQGPDCSLTVTLSADPARLVEGGGSTDVTVTARRTAVGSDTTVGLRFGGSAEQGAGRDYTVSGAASITIPANAASGTTTLTFNPLADGLTEGDENIIVEAVVGNKTEGSAIVGLFDPGALLPAITSATPYSLTVSWNEPAGGPFSDYDVRYRIGGGAFVDARHDGAARTATITGLAPDTVYEVQVRATNAMGPGAWSGAVPGRTKALLPGVTGNVPIYYFPHLAVGAGWQSTITYINYSQDPVTCQTHFIGDDGGALMVSFPGSGPVDDRTDVLRPGGTVHEETNVDVNGPLAPGWALAACSGPVKASLLFRGYDNSGAPIGEAGVNAAPLAARRFVTFAEQAAGQLGTGVAYANPSPATADVTFTARDTAGRIVARASRAVSPGGHGAQNMASLFGVASFNGSLEVTSTEPIVSLAINTEASPVFSSLPPGEPDVGLSGPTTYYFPHLAVGGAWQTTITYINYSSAPVVCRTDFISDDGGPLTVSFPRLGTASSRTDTLPPGGSIHAETDAPLDDALLPGWARAACSGPVKASLLYRGYDSARQPTGEAGVNAAASPATRFVTFGEQAAGMPGTGVAYANPSASDSASIFFTARDTAGNVLATVVRTLLPQGHDAQNVSGLFGDMPFVGSLEVTSTQPIVSLSINLEAAPVFSSLPPGDIAP